MTDIPSYFADITGMNETTAQLLLSIFIIFLLLLPYVILTRGNPNPIISLMLVFIGLSIALGLGWAPFWIMIMTIVVLVAGVAMLGTKGVTGGG
jgi:hypothetical protein